MHPIHKANSRQCQAISAKAGGVDAHAFFNLLTGPELFDTVELALPPHRERLFPPTETLSMFLAQALSADRSCQRAVNEGAIKRRISWKRGQVRDFWLVQEAEKSWRRIRSAERIAELLA